MNMSENYELSGEKKIFPFIKPLIKGGLDCVRGRAREDQKNILRNESSMACYRIIPKFPDYVLCKLHKITEVKAL